MPGTFAFLQPLSLRLSIVDSKKVDADGMPLQLKIINEPDFAAGRLSTAFMERFAPTAKASGSLAEIA